MSAEVSRTILLPRDYPHRRSAIWRSAIRQLPSSGFSVYQLQDDHQVVYVGKSARLRKRIGNHARAAADAASDSGYSFAGSPFRSCLDRRTTIFRTVIYEEFSTSFRDG